MCDKGLERRLQPGCLDHHGVDRALDLSQDRRRRPEVQTERVDGASVPQNLLLEAVISGQVCLSPPEDGLFGVSDHEQPRSTRCTGERQFSHDLPLHRVGVLELVDQQLAKSLALPAENLWTAFDQPGRLPQERCEVDDTARSHLSARRAATGDRVPLDKPGAATVARASSCRLRVSSLPAARARSSRPSPKASFSVFLNCPPAPFSQLRAAGLPMVGNQPAQLLEASESGWCICGQPDAGRRATASISLGHFEPRSHQGGTRFRHRASGLDQR